MAANTVKTVIGFLGTLARSALPSWVVPARFEGIYNYRRINDLLHTSGQPTAAQFALIRDRGFRTVINLAPHSAENALADQDQVLGALGMRYIHIPVDFKAPTDADFDRFADVMAAHGEEKLWVHCAANMRVSAFVFRYRRDRLGHDAADLQGDLDAIWAPFGAWKAFLAPRAPES
ncbi:MAG: protein tyrosine phosphatase family protein [Pseudomonadota bacterium]